jgi:glutathione synthase/RimK-type ligase-like ATP-grasp enzyme
MILIVTNRNDYTADFLILELKRRNAPYYRLNTEDFPRHITLTYKLSIDGNSSHISAYGRKTLWLDEVTSVWYRRPVPPAPRPDIEPNHVGFIADESRVALEGILASLSCYWVSAPHAIRRAELKMLQLTTAQALGFLISPTMVTNSGDDALEFYNTEEKNVIYKPLYHSRIIRGEKVDLIYSNPVGPEEATQFSRARHAPVLLQRYVPKHLEIRVTVIGSKVFAVEIHSQERAESRHDWRRPGSLQLRHLVHRLPADVAARCIQLVTALGLAFGAIDLILTPDGEYVFLEINPNGQWAWLQQMIPELPLRQTLAQLLIEAGS